MGAERAVRKKADDARSGNVERESFPWGLGEPVQERDLDAETLDEERTPQLGSRWEATRSDDD